MRPMWFERSVCGLEFHLPDLNWVRIGLSYRSYREIRYPVSVRVPRTPPQKQTGLDANSVEAAIYYHFGASYKSASAV